MVVTMKNAALWDVAIVRTDVSEECVMSNIRVTTVGEVGTLAVTSNQSMLQRIIVPLDLVFWLN
jgi:hypothetical protein